MTIVVAAKNPEGIIACYDTAAYRGSRAEYHHKVVQIGNRNMLLGISGKSDRELEAVWFNSVLSMSNKDSVQTLSEEIRAERLLGLQHPQHEVFYRAYIFGIVDSSEAKLLVSDRLDDDGLKEADYYGIGSGMYPEVWGLLRKRYDPGMEISSIKTLLEESVNLAKKLGAERKDINPLKGFGCTILTLRGLEVLAFSTE